MLIECSNPEGKVGVVWSCERSKEDQDERDENAEDMKDSLPSCTERRWRKKLKDSHVPVLFSRAMLSIAIRYARRTSSSLTTTLMRFHWSGTSSHWFALTANCVPRGLVSTSTSPTEALSGLGNKQCILLEHPTT